MIEVLPNGALRLCPAMLFCSVEHGVLCFAYVGEVASWTCVSVDHTGVTQEWDFVFVGCVEGDFGRLETDVELDFSIILEESYKSFLAAGDDVFRFSPVIWEEHVESVQFFSFLLLGVISSWLKTFFHHFSGDPLGESVVRGELSDVC